MPATFARWALLRLRMTAILMQLPWLMFALAPPAVENRRSLVAPSPLLRGSGNEIRLALREPVVVVGEFAGGQEIVFEQRDEDFSPSAELEFDEFFPHQPPE